MTKIIEPRDFVKLCHALGVNGQTPLRRWGYRNYYWATASDMPSMRRLCEAGYMEQGTAHLENGMVCFHATRAGADAIGLPRGALQRAGLLK